ncbi:MAG: GIY-YIG nuclease family protein [Cellvibrionaceae bacterium]|nr:GIY-YIG nuclease family protein [Cellvibrionaceae bacterium]
MIRSHKNYLYTGITTNISRRFQEHLDVYTGKPKAKGAKFFRQHQPIQVVYQKAYASRAEASRQESYIKRLSTAEKQSMRFAQDKGGLYDNLSTPIQ